MSQVSFINYLLNVIFMIILSLLCLSITYSFKLSMKVDRSHKYLELFLKQKPFLDTIKEHPGFPLMMGCNNWLASNFEGDMQCYSVKEQLRWLCRSHMIISSKDEEENNNYNLNDGDLIENVDILAFSASKNAIPHYRCSLSKFHNKKSLLFIDYLPRIDLIQSMDYYDKYFSGIDSWLETISQANKVNVDNDPMDSYQQHMLSKILRSPFAITLRLDDDNAADDIINSSIDRFVSWHRDTTDENSWHWEDLKDQARDDNLLQLIMDDTKYRYASMLGGGYAPQAREIAATIMGPKE